MTANFVAFHAAERPDAVAFIDNGHAITYAQFNREIRRCMRALSDLGASWGSWVGVGCDDVYFHWLLLVAFQRLGIATASLQQGEPVESRRLQERLDMVVSEPDFQDLRVKRHHAITARWIEEIREIPEIDWEALPPKSDDDTVRLMYTAGTTGEPKAMRSSRRTEDGRANGFGWSFGLTISSRYLITTTLNTGSICALANAVARVGGTIILETRLPIFEAISTHAITHVALFPIHLKLILDALPEGFAKPPNLTIHAFGATLSETLREQAMARLATVLYDNYGTREAGFVSRIASSGSGGIGTVWPDAQVEVVDETGIPLPPGQVGRLKIKTAFMHTEYLADPETTDRFFKDGWLLSGDLAVLHGPRRLQIIGRRDEMLNVGGNKVPPDRIEELVLRIINARDAGVVSTSNSEGIEEIWIAVADAQVDDKELRARLEEGLRPLQFVTFHLVRLPQIPRNAGGKIQRDLLKRAIVAAREVRSA
jgi:acyl-coenzyme A synthetase/AMP-(fatty) acid ligase